ncbi:inter-alpha-trypsin inhibitor heavy chain H2 precursor [Mesocricetus auratus]|uniref:Inter-alpha-trypsin inhibitor heavy chain H2 n=2 Tax=Mesocricetus auratus TaxID=10036 RepID=ITIH2_MESAU|nr:inter-alpha-trypsin inhibitor heavy chain H2 precursor [Mesocricetus auratus]P97279.1 RecName: Full=Inter-alpha-trypsin inhibitor heavy chain H2; Short=ITI heavy chain H2; Short=ITI-HC2; Short=Inter-alpha-inhibitor heavy chain 2; Flags: Precursor [Mesocricetus auratus]BAA13939.1 inter-alpha-trypsin inhibitor heavy chain 2 [Mesocricetus auratus]
MQRLACVLIWLFLLEEQAFEIPANEYSEFAGYSNLVELAPDKFPFVQENRRYQRSLPEESGEMTDNVDQVTLYSYKVQSTITSRMATTIIQSKLVNNSPQSQNVVFDVQIPKGAFISNFTMTVNGITFTSTIREKTVGRALYSQARAKGKTAGWVRSRTLDMENFNTEVNIPPGAKVQFELHYQEMKWRKLGSYEHKIHLQPGRLAKHLEVNVWIVELQGMRFLHVPDTFEGHFQGVPVISKGQKKSHVSFKPTVAQQRKCPNCTYTAVDGELVVMYDVNREEKVGELEVFNGYFVHFFAPENLDPIPKNILFVIDVSGSMWGIKMKQTVEAMKTILDDLRTEDQFSVVDFNHNVRTWRNDLVSATKTQITDAKRYIEKIQPSGGTNINEALLRAIFILNEASNLGMLNPDSVSLIVLVSDGDPTVGELKLSKIQKNVKQNIQDNISLFSLGIGFDVDYDFLKRLSNENRGIAQRIYGNRDTSSQLKKFYNQVSTPLLRNVQFNYPQASVTDVTQNSFHNYFGGSEIVVAGKYDPSKLAEVQSIITATSTNTELVLETLSQMDDLEDFLSKDKHADPNFTKKLWAYLTINQLLAERSLAPTAAIKRKITKTILQMSLDHHIVTPLTAMVIENEAGDERMLADSPPQDHSCCSGALYYGTKVASASIPSWASPSPTPVMAMLAVGANRLESTPPPHVIRVENDPHFIIYLPKSQKNICFNIDSEPGKILSLVSDPESGILVNGQLIGAKKAENGKLRTYFGKLGFYFQKEDMKIEISTENITLINGSSTTSLFWSDTAHLGNQRVLISVKKGKSVTLTLNKEMFFSVLLHHVWKKHPVNVDFLGIYLPPTNKFSPSAHGLLGQFMNKPNIHIFNERPGKDPEKPEASMEVKGHKLTVTRGLQKDYRTDIAFGTDVPCWFVHNSGKGFIDGHYKDYLVPQLYSFLKRP